MHLRAHLDDGFELDVTLFLARGDLDLGRRDHVDVVFGDRVDVELGQPVAERLLARDVGAHPSFEQPAWRLARAETGHPNLTRQLAERGVDRLLEFIGRDRDVELDLVALDRLDRALHKEEAVYRGRYRATAPPSTMTTGLFLRLRTPALHHTTTLTKTGLRRAWLALRLAYLGSAA